VISILQSAISVKDKTVKAQLLTRQDLADFENAKGDAQLAVIARHQECTSELDGDLDGFFPNQIRRQWKIEIESFGSRLDGDR